MGTKFLVCKCPEDKAVAVSPKVVHIDSSHVLLSEYAPRACQHAN